MTPKQLAELTEWARRVTRGQSQSAVFCSLWSDAIRNDAGTEPVAVFQLGYALVLDKPIIVIAPQGSQVPANLKRAATVVEYYDPTNLETMHAATRRALDAVGITVQH